MSDADHTKAGSRKRLATFLLVVLVAGAAFGIGRFSAFPAAQSATSTPSSTSAEAGFARDMLVHHAQAVDMSLTIFAKSENPDIRAIAYDIATSQSVQQGQMQEWLVSWDVPAYGGDLMTWMQGTDAHAGHGTTAKPSKEELEAAMGMASRAELTELDALNGAEADCLFLSLMVRHHKGAIEMTDAVQDLGSNARVLQVAQRMGINQTSEISALQQLQQSLGCPAS